MKRRTVLASLGGVVAAGSAPRSAWSQDKPIRVGSKNFTESIVVANMIADVIESGGFKVERKLQLGGTGVIHQALVNGDIDVYPEYTGTALLVQLKMPVENDAAKVYAIVQKEYAEKFKLTWAQTLGFNDTYALAMKRSETEKRKIVSISDMARQSGELRFGGSQEFLVRPDAIPGLEKTYGLKFKEKRGMDPGLVYQAIGTDNADVISVFTTDARIKAQDLKVLQDDKQFFPPYFLTAVVRQDALAANKGLLEAINRLGGKFTEDEMIQVNAAIDLDKRPAAEVSKEWLKKKGIIQ